MIYAEELSVDAIVEGIRNGRVVVKVNSPDDPMLDTQLSGERMGHTVFADTATLSALVTEDLGGGDLKIYFAGLTGGYSAKGVLGKDELVSMEPLKEVEMVFRCWEKWLQEEDV